MIEKSYIEPKFKDSLPYINMLNNKSAVHFKIDVPNVGASQEIILNIEFKESIIAYRNAQYSWVKNEKNEFIANAHSPKILVLSSGLHVLSNKNIGAWLISKKNPKILKWIFKHKFLTPVFNYRQDNSRDFLNGSNLSSFEFSLLFSKDKVPEFSRSKVPFSSIICFTDHCDFDTPSNLERQLNFFNSTNLKITKGIFLNDFSKKKENASYEENKEVYKKFDDQGHELAYHSLTQSLREKPVAMDEFYLSKRVAEIPINTWIDHGSQYYNITQKNRNGITDVKWASTMKSLGVNNLWSYVDSGISGTEIINQLNPRHFTYQRILKSNMFNFGLIFRSYFHFNSTEENRLLYKKTTKLFKLILYKSKFKKIKLLPNNIYRVLQIFIMYSLFGNKQLPFKQARFSPFIFPYKIGNETFYIFQTIEVTNFKKSFSKKNIDLLIEENGACIAHCYFSSDIKHQSGKFFNDNIISRHSKYNFSYLSEKIQNQKIWNPTIKELIEFHKLLFKMEFKFNEHEDRIICSDTTVPIRYISYV